MKKLKISVALLLAILWLSGCAGTISALKKTGRALKPWTDYQPVPSPQPGLVLPIHESPAVWLATFVCRGRYSNTSQLFVSRPGRESWLPFAKQPLAYFTINPPKGTPSGRGYPKRAVTVPLLLDYPNVDYTLVVFYQNFLQHCHTLSAREKGKWEIPFFRLEVKPFRTTGDPMNDDYQRIYYADKIIKLPRAKPYQDRQLTFHRIFYPGEVLMRSLGFR